VIVILLFAVTNSPPTLEVKNGQKGQIEHTFNLSLEKDFWVTLQL
jgi:hypothetical protein